MSPFGRILVQIAACCVWLIVAAACGDQPCSHEGALYGHDDASDLRVLCHVEPTIVAARGFRGSAPDDAIVTESREDDSRELHDAAAEAPSAPAHLHAAARSGVARPSGHGGEDRGAWLFALAARAPPLA